MRGEYADRVVAFARRRETDVAITIVPRISSQLLQNGNEITFKPGAWRDTV